MVVVVAAVAGVVDVVGVVVVVVVGGRDVRHGETTAVVLGGAGCVSVRGEDRAVVRAHHHHQLGPRPLDSS